MHGLLKAVWLLAPVTALATGGRPGRHDLTPEDDAPDMPWAPVMPVAPVAPTSPDMPELPNVPEMPEAPGAPIEEEPGAEPGAELDLLDFEIAELDFLYQQRAELEEAIAFQEQRLAEEYAWRDGESECHGLMCIIEDMVEKLSGAALSLYEGIAGVEDTPEGPRRGPHWRRPKHGRPGRKPHCPGRHPHHGGPHHGNHSDHGNHTFPHPPPWRRPHHPPPFCRCPPPPHRGGPPHGGPPRDGPPHGGPPHGGPPRGGPPHGGPPREGPLRGGRPPPEYETDEAEAQGIRPSHHHGHHDGSRRHRGHRALKITVICAVILLVVFALHKRLHGKYASFMARREARRRRGAQRKQFIKRLFFGWRRGGGGDKEQQEAMLPRHEEESSVEDELAPCRMAAGIVSEMVAAEEGRALAAAQQQQKRAATGHVEVRVVPQPSFGRSVREEEAGELLPAYDERSDSSVADGLQYTPGSSAYTPSSSVADGFGDQKA